MYKVFTNQKLTLQKCHYLHENFSWGKYLPFLPHVNALLVSHKYVTYYLTGIWTDVAKCKEWNDNSLIIM